MKLSNLKTVKGENIEIELYDKYDGNFVANLKNKQLWISPGWIDLHTHCFAENDYVGDEIDTIGVNQGVSVIVDAGSIGTRQLEKFKEYKKKYKTTVYLFMNISNIGLDVENELADLNNIDIIEFKDSYLENRDLIKGIKIRLSKKVMDKRRLEPIIIARYLSNDIELPIMVHVGNPGLQINEIIPFLKEDDIITHCFHGKEKNILNSSPNIINQILDKQENGLKLDVGHGSASFSADILLNAGKEGIKLNTISSDIYKRNRINGKVKSLSNVMTKILNLNYSLEEVIDAVTISPAQVLNLECNYDPYSELGVTLFEVIDVNETRKDSLEKDIEIFKKIIPIAVIKKGIIHVVQED